MKVIELIKEHGATVATGVFFLGMAAMPFVLLAALAFPTSPVVFFGYVGALLILSNIH